MSYELAYTRHNDTYHLMLYYDNNKYLSQTFTSNDCSLKFLNDVKAIFNAVDINGKEALLYYSDFQGHRCVFGLFDLVENSITEPVQEQITEPVQEQITEPVQEPVTEPVQEQVTETVQEQVTETVQEQKLDKFAKFILEFHDETRGKLTWLIGINVINNVKDLFGDDIFDKFAKSNYNEAFIIWCKYRVYNGDIKFINDYALVIFTKYLYTIRDYYNGINLTADNQNGLNPYSKSLIDKVWCAMNSDERLSVQSLISENLMLLVKNLNKSTKFADTLNFYTKYTL